MNASLCVEAGGGEGIGLFLSILGDKPLQFACPLFGRDAPEEGEHNGFVYG